MKRNSSTGPRLRWIVLAVASILVAMLFLLKREPNQRKALPAKTSTAPSKTFVKPAQAVMSRRELNTIDLGSLPTYTVFPFTPIEREHVWYEVLGTTQTGQDKLVLRDIALDKLIIVDLTDELKGRRKSASPGARFYPERGGLIRSSMYEGSGYMPEYRRATIRQFMNVYYVYAHDERYAEIVSMLESGETPLPKSTERKTELEPERDLPVKFDRFGNPIFGSEE